MPDATRTIPKRELADSRTAWLLQTGDSDLGDRFVSFDEDGVMVESLRLRSDFAAAPGFVPAVRGRASQLATGAPWLAAIRGVAEDAQGFVTIRAAQGDATRVRELLDGAACDEATASAILEQALYALSFLHRVGPDVTHSALNVNRIAIASGGHVRLLDCAFGAALGSLAPDEHMLFSELGVISGGRALDQACDVLQCAVAVLELQRGDAIAPAELRDAAQVLLQSGHINDPALAAWFRRALQLEGDRFADASDALAALQRLLPGTIASRAARVATLAAQDVPAEVIPVLQVAQPEAPAPLPAGGMPVLPPAAGERADRHAGRRMRFDVLHVAAVLAILLLTGVVVIQAIYIRRTVPVAITLAAPAVFTSPRREPALAPDAGPAAKQEVAATLGTGPVVRAAELDPAPRAEARRAGLAGGWLTVRAPFDVDVYSDGELIGTSRSPRIMLPGGRHTLLLANEEIGFRTTTEANVTAGRASTLDVRVPDGVLHVNASPWATVTIDGKSYGETPLGNLTLPVGRHEVVFHHPDLGDRRQTVVVTEGAPARLSVDFRK